MKILVPIFICAILPIAVVLIVSLTKMNSDNKRSALLAKALESNCDVDVAKLVESFSKPVKTFREKIQGYLLRGCLALFSGIALMGAVGYSVSNHADPNESELRMAMFGGVILMAVGISYLIAFFVGRRDLDKNGSDK
ncbi:MAG: hypothetical protein K2F63_01090 [Muribaculaceae bacterium]|nr:hypothetical protein [Muribaculaceae bacterium]MDE6135011.1 hypothetical protein [Muribaculaceae bacterium]